MMPQIPHEAVSDLADRGKQATEWARERIGRLPATVFGGLRARVNVLDLATREDVEAQSRLGRDRVSYVLKEFLEEQRGHDQELRESLRTELREELQCLATAIGDGAFIPDPATPARAYSLDDDDALDLVERD
jgi:hypothetical protein